MDIIFKTGDPLDSQSNITQKEKPYETNLNECDWITILVPIYPPRKIKVMFERATDKSMQARYAL